MSECELNESGKRLLGLIRAAIDKDPAFDVECRDLAGKFGLEVAVNIDVEVAIMTESHGEKTETANAATPTWQPTGSDKNFLTAMRISFAE